MKLSKIPILLIFLLAGCKEEYDPEVRSSEQSVLVVEGIINSGQGPTNIKLTRTFKLDDSAQLRPETGAQLTVETANGARFSLFDVLGDGTYFSEQLPLDPAEQYRLHINTSDGKKYVSEYVAVLKNPPIDSINWKRNNQGLKVFVNTHNPENDTRYYRWEYDETWELRSSYFAVYKMENGLPVQRVPEDQVYLCWRYFNSSSIALGSTARLSLDVVSQKLLLAIPDASEKLGERYSVLVRQYALDKKGYEFYQLFKKNTESLGSIFDAQPSESGGNIHSVFDSAERVIGFITAAPVQQNRIFISRGEVPGWGFRVNCNETISVPNTPESISKYFSTDYSPYDAKKLGPTIEEYYGARPECTDCTLRGGSTQRPSYW